jgi:hypothetical protein
MDGLAEFGFAHSDQPDDDTEKWYLFAVLLKFVNFIGLTEPVS